MFPSWNYQRRTMQKKTVENKSIYVIGDIHGCYEEFQSFLQRIEKDDPSASFVLVGDIIDRGPCSLQMLDWAMDNCNREDGKYQLLLGNHEHMKIAYLKEYLEKKKAGILEELSEYNSDRYAFRETLLANGVDDLYLEEIIQFFSKLPVYVEYDFLQQGKKQHYIVVHGDVPWYCFNKNETMSKRALEKVYSPSVTLGIGKSVIEEIVWGRNLEGHPELKHTTVVHGHTPTNLLELPEEQKYKGRICYRPHDINVDCGIVFKRRGDQYANLGALRLNDLEEFYFYV